MHTCLLLILSAFCTVLQVMGDVPATEVRALINLADSLSQAGDHSLAIDTGNLALEKALQYFGDSDSTVARSLSTLGGCYYRISEYARSESLFRRSMAVSEQTFPSDHPMVASALHNLATVCMLRRKYQEAEQLLKRAIEIRKRALGPDHPHLAKSLNNLALLCMRQGKYAEAEPIYEQVLETKKKILGPDDPSLAVGFANLAILYQKLGKYNEAEIPLMRGLEIAERAYGPDHEETAFYMDKLAMLYFYQGRNGEAEQLQVKALDIRNSVFGEDHLIVAKSLHNLGLIYRNVRKFGKAESTINDAIRIRENALGEDHPDLASSLNNLGVIYRDTGRLTDAEVPLRRALEIKRRTLDPGHPDIASSLNNLGAVCRGLGRFDEAEALIMEGLEVRESALGLNHPDVALSLVDLAKCYGSSGNFGKSLKAFDRLQRSRYNFIEHAFSFASEEQKLRYARTHRLIEPSLLSLALTEASLEAKRAALAMVLKGKAVVIDAISAEKKAAYCSWDENVLSDLDKHAEICTRIAALSLMDVSYSGLAAYRDRLESLYAVKDSLEAILSKRCTAFDEELLSRRFGVDEVAAALDEGAVLMEMIRYTPYDFRRVGSEVERIGPSRYAAFKLDHTGQIELFDLGDASHIDSLVIVARETLYGSYHAIYHGDEQTAEEELAGVTGMLYDLILAPLVTNSEGMDHILISPDGVLNLLPFEILACPDGQYAVEKYRISYLSSGRDLLEGPIQLGQESDRIVIMAGPDFDGTPRRESPDGDGTDFLVASRGQSHSPDCLTAPFNPLTSAREEGERIAAFFSDEGRWNTTTYFGSDASEDALKRLGEPPRVLHLATHGFFCPDENADRDDRTLRNSLLYSGLAFAGANRRITDAETEKPKISLDEDGILTSLEVSGLNLVGTDLVVLSACETGVGEVENGEGVFGLRRSFQRAGARTLVMSLWDVPDRETLRLMTGFYENWLSGSSRTDALRNASLKLLSERRAAYGCAHPLFWGGFVLVGEAD